VLLHGTSLGASPLQWVADSVLVARWAGAGRIATRLAEQARAHGQLDTVQATLEAVADLVEPADVAPLLAELSHVRPRRVERAARRSAGGPGGAVLRDLARRADGTSGIRLGAAALVSERLDLPFTTRPWATALHVATGRSAVVGRVLRRVAGMSARTAVRGGSLASGDELQFSDPELVDRYCGPGWSHVWPEGVMSHGDEARLVIPLDSSLVGTDVLATIEIRGLNGHRRFDVVVNGSLVARSAAGSRPTKLPVLITNAVAGRFHPLELAFRSPPVDRVRRRGFLDFQLGSIRFDRAEPAPRIDVEYW
jgi:hypothetical protein